MSAPIMPSIKLKKREETTIREQWTAIREQWGTFR
jgi:hypothetical protein